jgi:hypothetical protein
MFFNDCCLTLKFQQVRTNSLSGSAIRGCVCGVCGVCGVYEVCACVCGVCACVCVFLRKSFDQRKSMRMNLRGDPKFMCN